MEPSGFDTRAFLFSVKVAALVILLALGVRAASDLVFSRAYVNTAEAATQIEASRYQKLVALKEKQQEEERKARSALMDKNRILTPRVIEGESLEDRVPAVGKFIAADLETMQLSLYENQELLKTVPIVGKGRPGSYWETPTGHYEVIVKETSHFSSFGEVYMPYSMQFFGNFFIHGWPYYPDGTPVGEGYSGGCIRLSTEEAKEVYEFADRGTPLFVFNDLSRGVEVANVRVRNIPFPSITAAAYIVADINSGKVYAEHNENKRFPIASLTKLMTAVVASETVNFERVVKVEAKIPEETSSDYGSIDKGEAFSALSLMYPLLLESNNAVAHSISNTYGNRAFVQWMNKKAVAIGTKNTTFADASGISADNQSTVTDLFLLARYLAENRSFILSVSRTSEKVITAEDGSVYLFENRNPFSNDPGFLGGKTGYTVAARETMMSLFEIPVRDTTSKIAIVVLGSSDREGDTRRLRDWFSKAAVN